MFEIPPKTKLLPMMKVWGAVTTATTLCHQDRILLDTGIQGVRVLLIDNTATQNCNMWN